MNTPLELDPDFARHLEWQLRTEVRRASRFAPRRRSRLRFMREPYARTMRVAALVLVSLSIGGAAVYAAERYQDREQRLLHQARASMQLALAQRRADLRAESLAEAETKHASGLLTDAALVDARGQVARCQREVERCELDLEEVRTTGSAPRTELVAPRVAGADFVTRRLELDLADLDDELDLRRMRLQRARALEAGGVIQASEVAHDELEVAIGERNRAVAQRRLELRAAFLGGSLTARQAQLEADVVEAVARLQTVDLRLRDEQAEHDRLASLDASGLVPHGKLRESDLRLEELETEARLAQAEVEILTRELGR